MHPETILLPCHVQESLRVPLIVSAADYADVAEKEPLWTLSSKVAFPQ